MIKKIFVPILILLGVGVFVFISVKKTKPDVDFNGSQSENLQKSREYKIVDGNVVRFENGRSLIVADKKDFEEDSVQEFIDVKESPDGNHLCFLARTIVPVWMYVSDSDVSEYKKVTTAKNCIWSPDSTKVAFNYHTTDVSQVDVGYYDLLEDNSVNLTKDLTKENYMRVYDIPRWSEDNKKIISEYIEYNMYDMNEKEVGSVELKVD